MDPDPQFLNVVYTNPVFPPRVDTKLFSPINSKSVRKCQIMRYVSPILHDFFTPVTKITSAQDPA